jgi:hypothetical protein
MKFLDSMERSEKMAIMATAISRSPSRSLKEQKSRARVSGIFKSEPAEDTGFWGEKI